MKTKLTAMICAALMCAGILGSCGDRNTQDTSFKESEKASTSADISENSESDTPDSPVDDESKSEDLDLTGEESGITPAMWKITGKNGAEVTFMGSMHALAEEDYPLPDEITSALDNSDILAVEADISQTATINYQSALLANMYYDDPDDSLDKHISAEAYEALEEYLATYDLPIDTVKLFKPWAANNTAETLALQYCDLQANLGIDSYLIDKAKSKGKEVYEVEGIDFQMDILINNTDETFDALLKQYKGKTKDIMIDQLYKTHDAWRSGDIDTIDEMNSETAEVGDEEGKLLEEYTTAFLDDRNIGMEKCAKDFIDGDKNVFFVVGAAHFAGEKGIISLLEKDGYKVERIAFE